MSVELIYDNAKLSRCPRDVVIDGQSFQFFAVLSQVARHHFEQQPMTQTQVRICEYLESVKPRVVNAYELRDAVAPEGGIENMRVQIFKLRQRGYDMIEGSPGPHGGYRWKGD